jgi:hypothetical protein
VHVVGAAGAASDGTEPRYASMERSGVLKKSSRWANFGLFVVVLFFVCRLSSYVLVISLLRH